jgi:hypothetical protein
MGLSATSVEVSPFAAFVAQAKCVPRRALSQRLIDVVDQVLQSTYLEIPSRLEGVSTFTESDANDKWLFNRSVLRGYEAIDLRLRQENGLAKPLRLALLAAVMDCCNAKRDGKCLRYKRRWQALGYDSEKLRAAFKTRATIVIDDLTAEDFASKDISLIEGDCRQVLQGLPSDSFDLVVTSPPYVNSFDYSDVYRPELFLGRFVADNQELRNVRLKTLRSHVQVGWKAANYAPSPAVGKIFSELKSATLWNNRLPHMVRSYFVDLKLVLAECRRVVRSGGTAWIVVATSAYGGVEIPVDELIADLGERVGWETREIVPIRKLRSSGQHFSKLKGSRKPPLRESLVVFKKSY